MLWQIWRSPLNTGPRKGEKGTPREKDGSPEGDGAKGKKIRIQLSCPPPQQPNVPHQEEGEKGEKKKKVTSDRKRKGKRLCTGKDTDYARKKLARRGAGGRGCGDAGPQREGPKQSETTGEKKKTPGTGPGRSAGFI